MRASGLLARIGLVVFVMAGPASGAAYAQDSSAAAERADRIRHLTVDSTRITVTIGDRRSHVTVETPVGTYRVTTDSALLAGWARAASALAAPRRGEGGDSQYDGIVLRQGTRPDVMRLTRITADSLPDYQLDMSNGGWDHALHLRAAAAETLLAALRGEPDRTSPDERTVQERVWYEFQVDEPAVQVDGTAPTYPPVLREALVEGRVVLQYVVGPDGIPRPSSLFVVESSQPEFTRAVRETVLSMRFRPARRNGVAVAQYVQQPFEFRLR